MFSLKISFLIINDSANKDFKDKHALCTECCSSLLANFGHSAQVFIDSSNIQHLSYCGACSRVECMA